MPFSIMSRFVALRWREMLCAFSLALAAPLARGQSPISPTPAFFSGGCAPTAAVALDDHRMLVADASTASLSVHDINKPGGPMQTIALDDLLNPEPDGSELALEGGALLGDRLYWIGARGGDAQSAPAPASQRLFATGLRWSQNGLVLTPTGQIVAKLAQWLAGDKRMEALGLPAPPAAQNEESPQDDQALPPGRVSAKALARLKSRPLHRRGGRVAQAATTAAKPSANAVGELAIGALSASAEPHQAWIGLRGPCPTVGGVPCAVAILLKNPAGITSSSDKAIFDAPLFWDLNGRGIRAMTWDPIARKYWIVAGPSHGDDGPFALYRWSGNPAEPPRPEQAALKGLPADFVPVAILTFPGNAGLLLLSNDGARRVRASAGACRPSKRDAAGYCFQRDLLDASKRAFRGAWIALQSKDVAGGDGPRTPGAAGAKP